MISLNFDALVLVNIFVSFRISQKTYIFEVEQLICSYILKKFTNIHYKYSNPISRNEALFYRFLPIIRQSFAH